MFAALDASYLVDPHPSGIAVYTRELLNGLAGGYPQDRFLHLYRLKQFSRAPKPGFANAVNSLFVPGFLPWRSPDVFHALNQRVDRRLGRRVVCTFHDLFVMSGEYSTANFRARFTAQARRAADLADCLIAVSAFTRDQIAEHLHVKLDRIRIVPHGVHPPADPVPLHLRQNIILSVGALQRRKNIVGLVEAFERLPESIGRGWTLVFAGSPDGFGAAEILARIKNSPCVSKIQVRGYVAPGELSQLYRSAGVFAFPSKDEGFGIPVLEAMAHGIPVLTSNRSALPEAAGDAALLVDPDNVEEISAALATLISDSELRSQLRQRGLHRVKAYSWQEAVRLTRAVYAEL